ncbi:MAG: hypothetical protein KAS78_04330, partial [Candidatus Pacebacteria bacterium]|nr:hypothetical protein [Candidatus Paceibacterota bacterium]
MPIHKASAADAWDVVGGLMSKIVFSVLYLVSYVCLWAAAFVVKIGAYLVDVMLEPGIYTAVFDFNNPANPIMPGWEVIRDFANTFFIFILLLIAFSTILRFSKYGVKSLLLKFIIALFLINFSAIVALIIIDLGQVFMYEIISWMDNGFGQSNGAMGNLTSIVDNVFLATYDIGGNVKNETGLSMENAIGVSFAAIFTLIMGFVYILLAGFLLIRLTVLAILVVLSPVAFLGIIIPGLSSHAATWWKKLFEYSLFGPIFVFFVYLSSQMAISLTTYSSPTSKAGLDGVTAVIAEIIPYCVSIAMLLMVIPVTKQLGMAGSGALIGGTMGIGKIAMGTWAGVKLAGGTGKRAVGAPAGRIHSTLKGKTEGRFKEYNKLAKTAGGVIKKIPFIGEMKIKQEVAQAEKHQEKVAIEEKLMDRMTDVDKKNYVDSPKLNMNKKAERTQAMFNLLSKDSGRKMTDENLTKLFSKDKIGADGKVIMRDKVNKKGKVVGQEAVKEFDKDAFMSAHG